MEVVQQNLIEGCLSGNVRAQIQFYEIHSKSVFSSAYRILRNDFEAEEVMQETFITAFQKLASVMEREKLKGWLCRIATNKSLNYLKRSRTDWIELEDKHAQVEDDEDSTPWENVDVEKIYELIQQLPEGYRVILTLFLIEGYSHDEIANELGITSSTSRSQYVRAKKKLSELIDTQYVR